PAGTPLTLDFTAKGGIQPYQYTLFCTLPQGLTFNNGVISGTPTTTGSFSCRVVVSDAAGTTATKDFTLTVTPPGLALSGSKLPDGQVGVVYKTTIAATGGQSPVKYSGTGLPAGVTIAESGDITGTPTKDGAFTINVTATDSASGTVSAAFPITIAPAKLTLTATPLPEGGVGAGYSAWWAPAAAGGVSPYTWTVTGLPSDLTASSAGGISGTPSTTGTFPLSVTVKDNTGATASATFTLKIAAAPLAI